MTKYYHPKLALCERCRIKGEDAISCIIRGLPLELQGNARAYKSNYISHIPGDFQKATENGNGDKKEDKKENENGNGDEENGNANESGNSKVGIKIIFPPRREKYSHLCAKKFIRPGWDKIFCFLDAK